MLVVSLVLAGVAADSRGAVTASLILLGLGWSASVVAGSALVAESAQPQDRPALQGASDLSMNASGAVGGALAGPVLENASEHPIAQAATEQLPCTANPQLVPRFYMPLTDA